MPAESGTPVRGPAVFGVTGWADLHCHVLPRTDDGASSETVALEMLRLAEDDGVRVVAATPHAHRSEAAELFGRVERLNALASEAGIGVPVVPGQEVRIAAHLSRQLREGTLLTLNRTRYVLLELFLYGPWPPQTLTVVEELHEAGFLPILAHAERYEDVQRNPELVRPLVERGVPVQINADSLSERAERGARPAAEALLRSHLAHLIASDAHSASWRPPGLTAAYARAAVLAGADYARWMAAAAWSVIGGEPLILPAESEAEGAAG